jgi:hypothetical protein
LIDLTSDNTMVERIFLESRHAGEPIEKETARRPLSAVMILTRQYWLLARLPRQVPRFAERDVPDVLNAHPGMNTKVSIAAPTSRRAENRAGNLRGSGSHLLREGFNELSVPAVDAATELKMKRNFRRESPHGESVLQPAHNERMDQ